MATTPRDCGILLTHRWQRHPASAVYYKHTYGNAMTPRACDVLLTLRWQRHPATAVYY